ncbi:MAG: adenylate kinase [Methanobacterium sp.]|jgi:adenylate kinase|uniref:adenylate kinase n=1 Tax=Methanobacterium sp. TaxID=2164 RepID=UPI0003C9A576|nr:adenylate kinase [Methanobacterium sp.]MDI3549399.1 adenylate kinase [Methanobacterium sp.]CDG64895.1 Adenylate kinase [Methanobacterium sp. MB1]
MKVVVVAGIPGSGSTTVLQHALKETDYVHLNYGDVMLEIAMEMGLVDDRDSIRRLPPETQKEIQRKAAETIRTRAEESNTIVDTHCTIKTPSGFLPGLPKWVLEALQPDMFILIEADADEILMRRISDATRTRDMERAEDINLHQEMNRATAMAYAVYTGATVKIIENHNDLLENSVEEMKKVLN